jgi:hypothetical protein
VYPGPTWGRLAEIKRRYDPTNLFRRNQNAAARPTERGYDGGPLVLRGRLIAYRTSSPTRL